MLPHEVSSLGPQQALIFGPRNIVVWAGRRPYFQTEELRALVGPDPTETARPNTPEQNGKNAEGPATYGEEPPGRQTVEKRGGVLPALFGLLHGKLGWVVLAAIAFVPLSIWEIWIREPWNTYKEAMFHQYQIEALQKNPYGSGDPVESRNKAFWATFEFFQDRGARVAGAPFLDRIGMFPANPTQNTASNTSSPLAGASGLTGSPKKLGSKK